MRLTAHTRDVIRSTTCEVFGADAQVKLFGSRVDDAQRGGDIDLLIELPRHQSDAHKKSLTLAARLQMRLGDQRIDVVVPDPETPVQPIHHEAVATGVSIG
jgi:predicted nucleotidyltransferase